ncbi:FAD:protein FMN transferase [Streptomyces sp. NPDC057094]|uniref:FAD:protein FMN transferase n=1 Tax=Streptomyces sp. NPDC057094 TaxID=3346018 RepID=UPI003634632D
MNHRAPADRPGHVRPVSGGTSCPAYNSLCASPTFPPRSPSTASSSTPNPPNSATVVTAGDDLAIATSGTAERGLHVLDPHDGEPVTHLVSLTVVGPRLTMTDAYATAGFARGEGAQEWLESMDGYEAFAVLPDGRSWQTSGFSRHGS